MYVNMAKSTANLIKRVMLLPSSILVFILFSAAHFLVYALGLKDRDIYDPFGIINTPISYLLFTNSALFLWFGFVLEELNPVEFFLLLVTLFSFNERRNRK